MPNVLTPARYVDHIGFTVPNLEEAIAFFHDILGAHVVHRRGPYEANDNWMQEHLNVHPRAVIRTMALLQLSSGSMLEVFQYESPDQQNRIPLNSDIGGHHLAFFVDDIHSAVAKLKQRGVQVMGGVTTFEDGPCKGQSWAYFLAPWGMQLELVSYPPGWPFAA